MRRLAVALATVALLSGCQTAKDFLGIGTYQKPLPGQRVSVLQLSSSQTADPALADVKVLLPQPFANPEWPQPAAMPAMPCITWSSVAACMWSGRRASARARIPT